MEEDEHGNVHVGNLIGDDQSNVKVGNRKLPMFSNVLQMLGELLTPQTTGYNQVNTDMSFTHLDTSDRFRVENYSMNINILRIYGLTRSLYLESGRLATLLNANRSKSGHSMSLFTTTITKSDQKFVDNTNDSRGFKLFNFGKKKKE